MQHGVFKAVHTGVGSGGRGGGRLAPPKLQVEGASPPNFTHYSGVGRCLILGGPNFFGGIYMYT